jgi:transposase
MFDTNDDAKGGFRRVEILTGPARRRWSAEDKTRIVAETLAPGARVSKVSRRWQLSSQQVFGWRRAARLAMTTATTTGQITTGFVPIVTEANPAATVPQAAAPVIEIRLAGAVVRVASGVDDAAQLTVVLRGHCHVNFHHVI